VRAASANVLGVDLEEAAQLGARGAPAVAVGAERRQALRHPARDHLGHQLEEIGDRHHRPARAESARVT